MMNELTTIRLAGAALGFNWLPVFVAEELGLFAEHGLAVEYLRLGSVDKATAAVRAGDADLAITPPEGAITDRLAGGGLRIVAANSVRLPMSLVAQPDIMSVQQLRGKRIGTSSLTEGTAIYTQLLLQREGLRYPDDYEFVLAGVHTARWAALQSGEIDAAPQPAPWNFLAAREGYRLLGETHSVLPELVFAGIIGDAGWLGPNHGIVERFIDSLAAAHDIVNDPSQDAITSPIYQRITTPEDRDLAAQALTYTREMGMWPSGLRIAPGAIAATTEVMITAGLLAAAHREAALDTLDTTFGTA